MDQANATHTTSLVRHLGSSFKLDQRQEYSPTLRHQHILRQAMYCRKVLGSTVGPSVPNISYETLLRQLSISLLPAATGGLAVSMSCYSIWPGWI
jgi:hypothetical protein